ncbi:M15 family metallopeptidase [Promicromonospora soli]|uniref:D-alanyl-D-alanine carboxypeptidase-like core domain-containing protein n=1 Tax=Promicromonospora soli TaxID=2035533 RepID=A0A919FJ25_9MICO|nr:M15 family metallopeptidase [Promicromonospora soli]GHH66627.1 hypothetical protein GCM10017772_06950 [Promicromonospora soli]
MTLTNAARPAEPSDVKAGSTARERREEKRRRRRTTRAVVVATLVVVLAMGAGGLAWRLVSETDDLAAQNAVATELLASSDGKVAEQTTRVALSAQIGEVDSLLAEPILTRLTIGKADVRASLGAASDAVQASMVEFARSEVTTARKGLATAGNLGEEVYAATKGKGADAAVRARLRAALDTVTAVDVAANSSLSGTDLAELEQAALDLSANRSVVTVATQALYDAQDAVTCPAPDQVWDPDSGAVPKSELAPIPWSPTNLVRADVLDGLIALDAAYSKVFGEHLTINSSYRTYDEQKALYNPSSPIAAPPGCSNHGLGLAVDIGGGVETFGTEQYNWLKTHAKAHGWVHPAFAEPDGRVPEPWHWESVLARAS